jgi:zinc D-Ala-D-Ala carboxypeptidase
MNEGHARGGSGNGRLSEHFSANEFRCKCCGKVQVDPELISRLEKARATYGKPMVVTSGLRCRAHNQAVGGASESYHCKGQAVDIAVSDGRDRYLMLKAFLDAGFNRIGLYAKGWIHVDVGSEPADVCWVQ